MKVGKVRAKLVEMFTRVISLVNTEKNTHIYWNGDDNLYPNEIERVINNSPTAFRASRLMAKFIGGSGVLNIANGLPFKYEELPFVNSKKAYKITDIISIASKDRSVQGGVWFHIGYGINEEGILYQKTIDILPYVKPRLSKEDDNDSQGKIFLKDWSISKNLFGSSKEKTKWYYPYNPNPKVVTAQIKADAKDAIDLQEAIEHYRGQVFYLNYTPEFKYALPPVDSVFNDADSEYRVGLYTNTQTRRGFLGKTIVVTQGLDVEQVDGVRDDLAKFLGSEDSGDLYHLDVDQADDITKVIYVNQLKPQFDDKLFEVTDKRIRRNILGAFNNIPEALINASDGALFGTSADTYVQMKLFYSEQVEEDREKLQETLTYLGFPCKIIPIVEKTQTPTENV